MVQLKNTIFIFYVGVVTLVLGIYIVKEKHVATRGCYPNILIAEAWVCGSSDGCKILTCMNEFADSLCELHYTNECPPNEEYLICGSACPFNCSDPGPVTCSEDCVEGCFCKSGFLRNDTGVCVNADECIGETSPICSDNEEFLSCGTACARTCADPEPTACGLACSMGCFCKAGFVRDDTTKKCVTLDQCPAEQCLNKNEIYDICLASCEPSCDNPSPFCAKICSGGCVCAPGLLRNSDGECVSVDKCPSVGNGTDPGLLNKYMEVINRILDLSTA